MFGNNSSLIVVIFLSIVNSIRLQSNHVLLPSSIRMPPQYYYPTRQHYEQYQNRYYSNIQNYNRLGYNLRPAPATYSNPNPIPNPTFFEPNRMLYKRNPAYAAYPTPAPSITKRNKPNEIYLTTTTQGSRSKRLMMMMAALEAAASTNHHTNIINKTNGFVPVVKMEQQIRRKVSTADDNLATVTEPTTQPTNLIYPEIGRRPNDQQWKSEIQLPEPFMAAAAKDTSPAPITTTPPTIIDSATTTTTTTKTANDTDETSTSATTAITFIQRIESQRSKRPETSTIDPQTIIETIMRENRDKNPLVVGKRPIPEVSDSLEENLKILKSLQSEQNDILKQLAFLNRLRSKQNIQSQLGTGNDQFNFVTKLLNNIEKDKSETTNLQTLLTDLESKNNSKNHIYGETKEAVLAAVLKEQGIGPAAALVPKDEEVSTIATGTNGLQPKRKRRKKRPSSATIAADNVMIITPENGGNEIDDDNDNDDNWLQQQMSARKRKRRPQQSDDGPRAQLPPLQFEHVDGVADDQTQPAALGLLGPFVQQASKSFRTVFQLGSRTIGHLFRASVSGSGTGSAAMFPGPQPYTNYR